jgi:hypothetical protein
MGVRELRLGGGSSTRTGTPVEVKGWLGSWDSRVWGRGEVGIRGGKWLVLRDRNSGVWGTGVIRTPGDDVVETVVGTPGGRSGGGCDLGGRGGLRETRDV